MNVDGDVLGSPNSPYGLCGRKATLNCVHCYASVPKRKANVNFVMQPTLRPITETRRTRL